MKRLFRKKAASAIAEPRQIEPKRRRTLLVQDGLLILIVASLLVFNAAARGINLLMALSAFFIGFLAIDYFWGKRILRNLRVSRKLPDAAYAGEPFYVEIELDASKRRSASWAIVVEDSWLQEEPEYDAPRDLKKNAPDVSELDGANSSNASDKRSKKKKIPKKKNKRITAKQASRTDAALHAGVETLKPVVYFPSIHKHEKRKEYYIGVFARRGVRRLKALTISSRFPCGFYRSSERFDAADEIVVFPGIGRLTSAWTSYVEGKASQETSVSTSLTSRVPDETVAIRDWRQGDSRRTIAWRATAKRNRLQARDFTKRQTRSILVILDLYLPPMTEKESASERWMNIEKAVSFTATLVRRYTEHGDSQLYLALNADVPEIVSGSKKRGVIATSNDAPNDWDSVVGGGSTRRAFTRLALATSPKEDRLCETIQAAKSFNLKDKQVFVVSPEPIAPERLGSDRWEDAVFIDASSPSFETFFQMEPDLK
ncbi:MAG: DUF58 domain-containing protein [Thermoguttaceae bacterium]|nr:DUF58 domain-containing protein [Thermoguttaceae bacterium]